MISHYTVLISLIIGIPQGTLFAIYLARILGINGFLEFVLMASGCLLGVFLGYAEILLAQNIFKNKS